MWNGYFHDLPDGWHEFINVEHELFVGLVLVQAFDGYGFGSPRNDLVRLRPRPGSEGVEGLWVPTVPDRAAKWSPRMVRGDDCDLSFVEFFDWDRDGLRELEFVRAEVVAHPADRGLEGGQVLIPAVSASYFVRHEPGAS